MFYHTNTCSSQSVYGSLNIFTFTFTFLFVEEGDKKMARKYLCHTTTGFSFVNCCVDEKDSCDVNVYVNKAITRKRQGRKRQRILS